MTFFKNLSLFSYQSRITPDSQTTRVTHGTHYPQNENAAGLLSDHFFSLSTLLTHPSSSFLPVVVEDGCVLISLHLDDACSSRLSQCDQYPLSSYITSLYKDHTF